MIPGMAAFLAIMVALALLFFAFALVSMLFNLIAAPVYMLYERVTGRKPDDVESES